jgi:hypothetical protein
MWAWRYQLLLDNTTATNLLHDCSKKSPAPPNNALEIP